MAKNYPREAPTSQVSTVDTSTHPLVTAILGDSDPPPDRIVLVGYFGPSRKSNSVRLYLGLDMLCYYEIPLDGAGIISTEPVDPNNPHSATRVILNAGTPLELVDITALQAEAGYLRGNLTASLLARAAESLALEDRAAPLFKSTRPNC
jgi:hypothetical protein